MEIWGMKTGSNVRVLAAFSTSWKGPVPRALRAPNWARQSHLWAGVLNHLVRWGFCWKNSSLRDFLYILKSISAPIGAWEWWLTDWPTNQRTDGPTDRRTKRVIMIQNWCVENCSCDDFSLIEYVLSGLRSAMRKLVLAGDISDTFNITSS